jgi:C1A family cysteine protease
MLIVGYNDAYTTTTGAVRVQNSFGTGWGDNGFVWIAYNALESMAQGEGCTYRLLPDAARAH